LSKKIKDASLVRKRTDELARLGYSVSQAKPFRFAPIRSNIMNKDQIEGKLKNIGGKVQEEVGDLIDSPEQEAKGLRNQAEGKVQEKVGDLKEAARIVTK
jgi:uncharacterized protein YjbJ (UPF0337 family)